MGTRIQIDSVMCARSSSRGRNTSASVTVTVTNEHMDRTVDIRFGVTNMILS